MTPADTGPPHRRRRARGSLRLRLALAGSIAVGLALALSGAGLSLLFEQHVERRVESELAAHLDQLVGALDIGPDGALRLARTPADPRFSRPLSGLYWQIETVGDGAAEPAGDNPATLLRSRSLWDQRLGLPADTARDGEIHRHRLTGPLGHSLMTVERFVVLPGRLDGRKLRVAAAVDRREIAEARRAFVTDMLPYLLLLGGFLVIAGWAQLWIGLKPLAAVRRRLGAVTRGSAGRLGGGLPAEVQPLADQIDAALEDRERAAKRAGARAADLAHGLKTPLQALAGDADRLLSLGQPEIARDIEGAVRLMQRHVDREMARARLDAARPDATCAPAQVADRLVRLLNRAPPGDRLDWYVSIPPDLRLGIDADDLSEALGNLLENAARHARSRVVLRALIHGDDDAAIEVADDGPGIAEAMLHRVTARGTRLDHRGPGAGLGLAIVQDIAEAWSGSLTLRNGPTPDADSARAPGLVARIDLKRSARMPRAGGATA